MSTELCKSDYIECVNEIQNVLSERLGEKLKVLFVGGSYASAEVIAGFSDLDIRLVLDRYDFDNYRAVGEVIEQMKEKYGIKIGMHIMLLKEYLSSQLPVFAIVRLASDLALLSPDHILLENEFKPYVSKADVSKTSFVNLGFIRAENSRMILDSSGAKDSELEFLAISALRRCSTAVQFALFSLNRWVERKEHLAEEIERVFPEFSFDEFKALLDLRTSWHKVQDTENFLLVIKQASTFVESFLNFFFYSVSKHPEMLSPSVLELCGQGVSNDAS